jgi:large subunit ribosomal protein L17
MMVRNLVTSLLLYERVRTTKKRAEVAQPIVDRLLTIARTEEPYNAIRALNRVVTDKNASRKAMEVFRDRYKTRASGFTTMVPVGSRQGDGAEVVDLMLIDAHSTTNTKSTKKTTNTKSISADS